MMHLYEKYLARWF